MKVILRCVLEELGVNSVAGGNSNTRLHWSWSTKRHLQAKHAQVELTSRLLINHCQL